MHGNYQAGMIPVMPYKKPKAKDGYFKNRGIYFWLIL